MVGMARILRRDRFAAALLLLAATAGCISVKARDTVFRNKLRDYEEVRQARARPADPWAVVLKREGLLRLAERDPAAAATQLEERLRDRPEADGALALAELAYRAGIARQATAPDEAIAWLRDAAALATLSIREPGATRLDLAEEVHNRSMARLIRVAQAEAARQTRGWPAILADHGVTLEGGTPDLAPARFSDLVLTEDIQVDGMRHVYRNGGLGTTLIAHRRVEPNDSPDPLDRFHPRELRSPATAVMLASGSLKDLEWRKHPTTLSLRDPFLQQAVDLGEREVPLAGDRTTPMAVQAAQGSWPTLEFTGLFDSDFKRPGVEAGLYLFRPYEVGKIPVVLVHGLFSSPRAFLQVMNELENDPEITRRYQFWVFMYPTGQPIPSSAAKLRSSLQKIRAALDPNLDDHAMDRMVLVGHSMGGLLAKMMAQDTGLVLWDAAFRRPPQQLLASKEVRELLDESMIFQPMPFVKRLVFIATPHRGSPIADQWFGRTVASFIHKTDEEAGITREIVELNGPGLIAPELRRMPLNAIGNLRTDSPILQALEEIPINPAVPFHSIIPQIGGVLPTDGVVPYRSSHLDRAESELIVPGVHSAQQDPDVIAEVRRILLLHLKAERGRRGDSD
jgi:pimeloyl-ACP methyl ester carboxylesterase